MEPISIDPVLSFVALYDKTKKLLSIMDMTNDSTVASYDQLELNTTINLDQCWTYYMSRKRSHCDKKNGSLELDALIPEKINNVSGEYFVCCTSISTGSSNKPSILLNNIKKNETSIMEMSHQYKQKKLSINTLVVHPFDHFLFTGCNDGSIVRWSFGEKRLTKLDYTCSSSVIAMALNSTNNTLIFMEEKGSTIHVVSIDKSLKSLFVLKNEINHSHISLKIVNNDLFGFCGNDSAISLFKTDNKELNKNFVKFHSIQLKNNVSDFDVVEYNNLYYLIVLNRKRTSLSVYSFQNVDNSTTNNDAENTPIYSINISSNCQDMNIIKIKLIAQTAKNISPMCLVYYTVTQANQSTVKISIIYLDDLNLGVNNVEIGTQEIENDTLKSVINHMTNDLERNSIGYSKTKEFKGIINQNNKDTNEPLPTTKTLVQTLTQVINSNDNRLLEDIINRTSTPIIDNSIPRLSSPLAYRLLALLTEKIESNPAKSSELSYWIKSILSHHVSFFSTIMANNDQNKTIDSIQKLQNILEFRSHFYGQLCEIQGRVSVLINHVKQENTFDKQSQLEYNMVEPAIKIDDNALEEALYNNMFEDDSTDYSDESNDVDMDEMESFDES